MAIDEFFTTPFGNGAPRWLLGSAIPTAGTYFAGDIIFNSAPVGSSAMFVCTVAGTPGTWVSVPIGNNASGATRAAVSPTTGTYNAGDVVFNSTPAAGSPIGWINTVAGSPGTFIPFGQINSAAAPVSGTYNTGDIVWNAAPASGQPSGWVCTAGGSPGTFVPFGQVNLLNSSTTTATSGTLSAAFPQILLNPATTGTYSLPNVTAFAAGAGLFLKNIASGSTTLTPLGANNYADAAAITLAQFGSVTLKSAGGTTWYRQQ